MKLKKIFDGVKTLGKGMMFWKGKAPVKAGEIHALPGENGAGKTTLMNKDGNDGRREPFIGV